VNLKAVIPKKFCQRLRFPVVVIITNTITIMNIMNSMTTVTATVTITDPVMVLKQVFRNQARSLITKRLLASGVIQRINKANSSGKRRHILPSSSTQRTVITVTIVSIAITNMTVIIIVF
jgi:hypothetical protein